jgi:hypothetical protein
MFQCDEKTYEHIFLMLNTEKSLWWSSLSDVLNRPKGLRTYTLPTGRLKNDFVEVDEAIIQGDERPSELIFYILGIQKSDLYEVPEMMF